MAPAKAAWEQSLVGKDGQYTFEVRPLRGRRVSRPINTNGSQRGGRPIIQLLPHRIDAKSVKIIEGAEFRTAGDRQFSAGSAATRRRSEGFVSRGFRGEKSRRVRPLECLHGSAAKMPPMPTTLNTAEPPRPRSCWLWLCLRALLAGMQRW